MQRTMIGLALAVGVVGMAHAAVHKRTNLFTSLEAADCKVTKRHADGNAYDCRGLPGYPIYFAEGDLRSYMSFGAKPDTRRAAKQTLAAFNTPFEQGHRRATIEWRFVERFGRQLPYATIVRYFVSRDGARGQILVVTRVTEREACHVAYVDAVSNPDAIQIARRVADEVAPGFDCKAEPSFAGVPGLFGG